jgi:trimethylamine-N-oxide reductase (cytochrome c)
MRGRIVRISPIEFDETDAPSWRIEARGGHSHPTQSNSSPFTVGHRSTIYSPKRILTPLKRTDFNPKGNRNCHRRGESGYEPISWEEALDIVTEEITRVKREAGHAAIAGNAPSHHLWGNIGYYFSAYYRFMNLVGFSYAEHDPDSWEGWHWGGTHMSVNSPRLGLPEQYDLLEDALKHTEMIVFWSSDPNPLVASTPPSRVRPAPLAEGTWGQ